MGEPKQQSRTAHRADVERRVHEGLEPIAEKFHVVIELEPTDLQAW